MSFAVFWGCSAQGVARLFGRFAGRASHRQNVLPDLLTVGGRASWSSFSWSMYMQGSFGRD